METKKLATRIKDAPRTACSLCGDEGWCWAVEGVGGYIDACEAHAEGVAKDALADESDRVWDRV